jgi:malate synthase
MGGMAAQIPIKTDPEANALALGKVRDDKVREAGDGHDGTWVAHPGLVPIAMEVFNERMPGPNQLDRMREDVHVLAADLLTVPSGPITEAGLRVNINVGLRYLESWLRGSGCVPIFNLMEDAATCEISRTQIWQWIRHAKGVLNDGRKITVELFRHVMDQELAKIRADIGSEAFEQGKFPLARQIFDQVTTSPALVDFLTLPAYEQLL